MNFSTDSTDGVKTQSCLVESCEAPMDGLECTEKFGKLCGKDSGLTDQQINLVLNVKKHRLRRMRKVQR